MYIHTQNRTAEVRRLRFNPAGLYFCTLTVRKILGGWRSRFPNSMWTNSSYTCVSVRRQRRLAHSRGPWGGRRRRVEQKENCVFVCVWEGRLETPGLPDRHQGERLPATSLKEFKKLCWSIFIILAIFNPKMCIFLKLFLAFSPEKHRSGRKNLTADNSVYCLCDVDNSRHKEVTPPHPMMAGGRVTGNRSLTPPGLLPKIPALPKDAELSSNHVMAVPQCW